MSSNRPYYRKLINSGRWRRTRAEALRRAKGLCEDCKAQGRLRVGTEVHHIQPVEWLRDNAEMERAMFDQNNLVVLCHVCHVERHYLLHSQSERRKRANDALKRQIELLFPDRDNQENGNNEKS